MKSKTMILMGVAVVCGLGASYMTSRLIAERNETVPVLIAKDNQHAFTLIKEPATMFEPKELPRNEVPKNAVVNMDDLKDRILLKGIAQGQPVLADDLQDKNKAAMDAQIPVGKRLVAIRTDAANSGGGFVTPGSHVDVCQAMRIGDNPSAKTLLENILVRAVDLTTARPDDKPGMVPATVTLEVSPQQGLTLTSVKDMGLLTLALRNPRDDQVILPEMINLKVPALVPPPPKCEVAAKPEPACDKQALVIYNGTQWTRAIFVTKNGETTTSIEHSKEEAGAAAAAVMPPSSKTACAEETEKTAPLNPPHCKDPE